MLNQSFRQVFVTNSPALLADGATVENIGVGQIGILDAKTHKAVASPTYATNKALEFVWGTPDLSYLPASAGVPNENEYSKLVKGKLIKNFRGKAAKRGRNQILTVGFSGDVSDTDTINARPGEQKFFYLKATGPIIDKLFSTQGVTRQYFVDGGCVDDCTDTCATVADPRVLSESLARQINTDPTWGSGKNRFVKASVVTSCDPDLDAIDTVDCYRFEVAVCDTRDDVATGIVQAQYPTDHVVRSRTIGSQSVYSVIKSTNSAPAAVSNAGFIVISDCPTCPTGYTLQASGYVYSLRIQDAGDDAAMGTAATTYGISGTENISRLSYNGGYSTYVLKSATPLTQSAGTNEVQSIVATGGSAGTFTLTFAGQTTAPIAYNATASAVQSALEALPNIAPGDITVAGGALPSTPVTVTFNKNQGDVPALVVVDSITGGDAVVTTSTPGVAGNGVLQSYGQARNSCVITTPSTAAWTLAETLVKYPKTYRLTVADSICGTNRLTDIQAAFPDNTVSIVDAGGDCVHTYETVQYSQCVPQGCSLDTLVFQAPAPFEGADWTPLAPDALPDGTVCKTGVRIEVAFVNRLTGECTYDYFPYESDTVHLQASQFDPNYNNAPDSCVSDWKVKEIQSFEHPAGFGSHIRKLEQQSKSYQLRERSFDPVVRDLEGYQFQAVPDKYYDEYIVEYEYQYLDGGWSRKHEESYSHSFFFPEGQGKAFEDAMNAYVTSVGLQLDPVVL